ncbi:MAG: nucleotidyltransferase family protein [Ignavibacteriales bacterium]|nr:nucleotidyltransferase family protein [Ignavibacteriales bacterium]
MITGIVLTAGTSARMGRCKALLPYKGTNLISHVLDKLAPVCDEIIIVTGKHHDEMHEFFSSPAKLAAYHARIVTNKNYLNGMFSSLQVGISGVSCSDWILYHFVDQPGLPPEFYKEFVTRLDNTKQWLQPTQNGRRAHPVCIHHSLFAELLAAPPELTMRDVFRKLQIDRTFWEYDGTGLFDDLDTPEDYMAFIAE